MADATESGSHHVFLLSIVGVVGIVAVVGMMYYTNPGQAAGGPVQDSGGRICKDSDGKNNFLTAGYVKDGNKYYYDSCQGNVNYDYYCATLPVAKAVGDITPPATSINCGQ